MAAKTCLHGGVFSVNPALVKVDFSSNVNPLGISKRVLRSIQNNLNSLFSMYPDPECRELKKNLLNYMDTDLDAEWITVGNGATELIHSFARTFIRKKAIIFNPTFCEYELASKRMGADILFISLKNLNSDYKSIIEKSKDIDAIFLCNPNNPTGLLVSANSIIKIIENVDSSTKVLIDECFIELIDKDPAAYSLISRVKEFDNLLILRSLTKSFGLAGLRVGYMVCNPKLTKQLSTNKIPWNVNGVAQMAGILALKDLEHLTYARLMIKTERSFLQREIKRKMQSFTPRKSDVNYFLIHLKNKDSTEIRDYMLKENGILVRDCSTFTGMSNDYIRVAVKTHEENLLLLDALESSDK